MKDFNEYFKLRDEDEENIAQAGYVERFSKIEYAQIERHNRLCNNGVILIDSPGLKEDAARTKMAHNFLKQSQAIIFVLRADKLLGEDEKEFFECYFQPGKINNVFIVVSFIDRAKEQGQQTVDKVKRRTKKFFEDYYLNREGDFDRDFYNRRVFFVNALGALEVRTGIADKAVLNSSGVLELEEELEKFLASPEKVTATFDSTVELLSLIVSNSCEQINQEKLTLDQPLNELEERRKQAEEQLLELEKDKIDIEQTIFFYRDKIKEKLLDDLIGYTQEIKETWQQDSHKLIDIKPLANIKDILLSTFREKSKTKIRNHIKEACTPYIESKLKQWETRIPILIEEDIHEMQKKLDNQLSDFQLKVDKIKRLFTFGKAEEAFIPEQKKAQKIIQAILGGLTLDVSQVTGALMGKGDWLSFLGRRLQEIVLLILVVDVLAISNFLAMALIALFAEGVFIKLQRDAFQREILKKLGEKIPESMREVVFEKRNEFYQAIEEEFEKLASKLTNNLQEQIDGIHEQQEQIIKLKQEGSNSINIEKSRLYLVGEQLIQLFNEVSMVTYGKHFTPEEIQEMSVQRKNIFMAN
ncbi:dynamin family protein [Okeania sp. SIO1I7]|uniref:dynamin family protein n=1 Tax=Okeania sp. SIO1I7 TaxID=2607772 RepID=UPI0013F7EA8D|nr:dynamin family protein [Okeania sp. SIO1I7]NET28957.1 hypothetical protein [Okeania sp. SIO1I7]